MRDRKAIWQELAQLGVRPPVDDERSDQVEVRARIDALGDAGGDDGQDGHLPGLPSAMVFAERIPQKLR